jgi:plastocyanin
MIGGRIPALLAAAAAVVVLSGCELSDRGDNLVNGKTLFVAKCGTCHTLARADAKGTTGPNLDEAWQQAAKDGFGRSTYKGIVHRQIMQPNRFPQTDPASGKQGAAMPANIVKGEDAEDVAAYVASAAAAPGKDPGRLAQAGKPKSKGVAKAKGGKLDIPVGTGLSYQYASAEAPAGKLTIDSVNDESIGHNIAVEGNGVDEKGPVVQGGATSKIEVTLKPGDYTFYCSVPGHREGGMAGKLTVK